MNGLKCVQANGKRYSSEIPYSTTERKIGTWIDGKPLYRKVYTSTEFLTEYNLGVSNVREVTDFRCKVNRKDYPAITSFVPSRLFRDDYKIDYHFVNTENSEIKIGIEWGSAYNSSKVNKVVFVVEYTKNTD